MIGMTAAHAAAELGSEKPGPAVSMANGRRFSFTDVGRAEVDAAPGWPALPIYRDELGYGFEAEFPAHATADGAMAALPVNSGGRAACYFSVKVPEGNYRVTASLKGAEGGSRVTIKAELRRWMAGPLEIAAGQSLQASFVVNVRTARIAAGGGVAAGRVDLKVPRETEMEAWAWDDRLTLEFNGQRVLITALEIKPVTVPTLYLLGDSTVCDQPREPYASWGQALTRLFDSTVAVSNQGESGESYRDSLARRRIDKIVSSLRPGDWVLLQFGHNDQKQIPKGEGGPFTTYMRELAQHVRMIQKAGGVPVVLSSMERRRVLDGHWTPTLGDYAEAARRAAAETGAAFIDLHAMSQELYATLGETGSAAAFAAPEGKIDNTHHSAYGAYLLARCVAAAAYAQSLGFSAALLPEYRTFDPQSPEAASRFDLPASPLVTQLKPLGD